MDIQFEYGTGWPFFQYLNLLHFGNDVEERVQDSWAPRPASNRYVKKVEVNWHAIAE
jgi:hypothetical protein